MRNGLLGLASVLALASATATGGCTSSAGGSGTGGTSAGAGTAGSAGGGSCSDVTPCGGNVVGTWTVTSSCLNVTGALDLSLVGAGCPTAPVTGALHVTGTWTANADGTLSDGTTTSGDEQFTLAPSCLVISSTPVTCDGAASIIKNLGYASLTCTATAGGGCACAGTVQQTGGIGIVSVAPSTTGNYSTSGNTLTMTGDVGDTPYAYCVSGGTLTSPRRSPARP